ncbi:MAG: DUF86 domain-containing protein [Microbacterium sp.]|uniref:HepT-like ribonuclease domain-containing protein n=1 Tax=Microbacterium sp. TaxID=51671 RepID=UPI002716CE68|nr:HepT-like ribonuclease domain-containing protein [Microbacterium sp.]MDO8381632.1 DUF86 domain-containing protein [Microbacterium sp.]
MTRSAEQRIQDILGSIHRCRRYATSLDSANRDLVDMAEDAVERNLQIIGEAASHLPVEITDNHPEIAWPQIRGFRNILVQQYFGVDVETVREVIETYLPNLEAVLRTYAGE